MKVMQFIHGLNTGGAETLVKEYALNFDKSVIDVVVLCFEHFNDSPYEKQLEENNIRVIYICDFMKYYNKKNIIFKIINKIERNLLVKKIIRKEKPDIIHSHLLINSYIKFSKPKKDTKIFYTVHSEPKRYWPSNKNKEYKAAKYLVKKYKMKFICLHEKMKNKIDEMFNVNNSIVLNNGIDFSKYDNLTDKKIMREKLNIPSASFVIGHIGRFTKVKNHEFLIDIFNEVFKRNNKSFLLMIGIGEEKDNIKNKLHKLGLDNHYLILSNRDDIPDLLNSMDVFVFPSIYEGLPISLIEAQKIKLPCFISTNVPDATIISNLVTKISLETTSKKWSEIILSYKIPKTIELNDKEWDIKQIVKRLEKLYMQ